MSGLLLAEWIAAEGIIVFKQVNRCHRPPMPGQLLASSGAFVLLAFIGQAGPDAEKFASIVAFGLLAAAWMNLFNKGGCPANQPKSTKAVTAV